VTFAAATVTASIQIGLAVPEVHVDQVGVVVAKILAIQEAVTVVQMEIIARLATYASDLYPRTV
jgi:hypothetical protein